MGFFGEFMGDVLYLDGMKKISIISGICSVIGIIITIVSAVFLKESGYVLFDIGTVLAICMVISTIFSCPIVLMLTERYFIWQLIISLILFVLFMIFFKHSTLATVLTYIIVEIILLIASAIVAFFKAILK